jgi:hypothetical protein
MTKLKNLKMNNETYRLRRKVIDIIYMLKKHVELPRITVRITEPHERVLGKAAMDGSVAIWITSEATKMSDAELLHVVAHEIGHTVFKLQHDETCPLMAPQLHTPANLDSIIKVLTR